MRGSHTKTRENLRNTLQLLSASREASLYLLYLDPIEFEALALLCFTSIHLEQVRLLQSHLSVKITRAQL